MSCVEPISNHSDQAVERLINYFKSEDNNVKFVRAFLDPMQHIEDTLDDLCDKRLVIADTEGVQLDRLGVIVGASRGGRLDPSFRNLITAHIFINTSKGTPEDLIRLFNLLTGSTKTELITYYPFVVEIYANIDLEGQDNSDTLELCKLIVPSATLITHIVSQAGADAFSFDGIQDGKGWGSVTDINAGGKFAWIAA